MPGGGYWGSQGYPLRGPAAAGSGSLGGNISKFSPEHSKGNNMPFVTASRPTIPPPGGGNPMVRQPRQGVPQAPMGMPPPPPELKRGMAQTARYGPGMGQFGRNPFGGRAGQRGAAMGRRPLPPPTGPTGPTGPNPTNPFGNGTTDLDNGSPGNS